MLAGIQSMDSRRHNCSTRWNESGVSDKILEFNGQRPFAALPPVSPGVVQGEPDRGAGTDAPGGVREGLIRYKLTGEFATDPSEASSGFTDVRTQDYSDEAFSI